MSPIAHYKRLWPGAALVFTLDKKWELGAGEEEGVP